MSSVATMIAKIEDQMDAGTDENTETNPEHLRMVEALLFAASEPLDEKALSTSLPEGADVPGLLQALEAIYEPRGVNLCCVAGKYQFRTASDLAFLLRKEQPEQKRLSKAAIETLSIISYHQPVTRAEIEDIRGVAMSKGTIDILMEIGWIKIRGRKRHIVVDTLGLMLNAIVHSAWTSSRRQASWKPFRPPALTCPTRPANWRPTRTRIRAKSPKTWPRAASTWTRRSSHCHPRRASRVARGEGMGARIQKYVPVYRLDFLPLARQYRARSGMTVFVTALPPTPSSSPSRPGSGPCGLPALRCELSGSASRSGSRSGHRSGARWSRSAARSPWCRDRKLA